MYQAWARFKQMLNACPHHMQTNEVLDHTFFEGLDYNARVLLNSATGGQALAKTCEKLFNLLDRLSEGNPGWPLNGAPVNVIQQAANWCGVCGSGANETKLCEENPDSVNYLGNAQKGGGQQNYGNTYNPSWRNHPNFSWGGNQNQNQAQGANQYRSQGVGQQYQNPNQRANPNAPKGGMTNEELLQKIMAEIGTKINARIDKQDENIINIQMSQMSLEKQVAQVANSLNIRPQGGLPVDNEPNPKQLNTVSTRSGLQLEELAPKKRDIEADTRENKVEEVVKSSNVEAPIPQKKLPPLFPQRLRKHNNDECFGIPKYAKYVKEVVDNKTRLIEYETVALTRKLSEILVDAALRILKQRKKAIGWQMVDIHGISPALCMHKIYMEDDHKTSA
ncbi:uncharacterized protein LOC125823346 [Solanum verrucosum]|uniref:uncharacterized protein LOC125823346 n=1 Tax=Solanum verrucosum TaxID=315347 RepID=UPI0020D0EF4A|nr:uncharacterized protein LOC125823346 [Solanum verrucosum]